MAVIGGEWSSKVSFPPVRELFALCFYPHENDPGDGKVGDTGLWAGRDSWCVSCVMREDELCTRWVWGPNQQHLRGLFSQQSRKQLSLRDEDLRYVRGLRSKEKV